MQHSNEGVLAGVDGADALPPPQRALLEQLVTEAVERQRQDLAVVPAQLLPRLPAAARQVVTRILAR